MPATHFRQRVGERFRYQQPIKSLTGDTIASAAWDVNYGAVSVQVDNPLETSVFFRRLEVGSSMLTCHITSAAGEERITKLLINVTQ